MLQYRKLPQKFWDIFPRNMQATANPNISWVRLKQVASAVGVSDKLRLNR